MWRPPLPGLSRVGRYWLECEIGRGGMGAVHLASSRGPDGFKKLVAIKTLLPALDGGDRFVKMLLDEARVASGLMHPNIVQLYDLGQDGALPFLVMEYVHGESLASIESFLGRLPDRIAVEIACQVLDALAYASELPSAGGKPLALVHRDLSPQNVLVSYDGVPKLVDFGIARATVR
jgi:serine/threonine protein kinase